MASQDPMLAPPDMLTTCVNISEWSKLCKVDEKSLASYEKKCDQVNTGKITMTNMPKRNRGIGRRGHFPGKQKVH
jgi:hypothetical protein